MYTCNYCMYKYMCCTIVHHTYSRHADNILLTKYSGFVWWVQGIGYQGLLIGFIISKMRIRRTCRHRSNASSLAQAIQLCTCHRLMHWMSQNTPTVDDEDGGGSIAESDLAHRSMCSLAAQRAHQPNCCLRNACVGHQFRKYEDAQV